MTNIKDFIEHWVASARTPNTARERKRDALLLLDYLGTHELEALTLPKLQAYIQERLGEGDSPRTVCRRVAHIRSLCETITDFLPTWINPARRLTGPSFEEKEVHGLSSQGARALIDAAYQLGKTRHEKLRNGCIVETMLSTGMRCDEVLSLRASHISDDGQWFENVRRKGGKYRNIFLPSPLVGPLREYLVSRGAWLESVLAPPSDYPLFLSSRHVQPRPLSARWLHRLVTHAACRAGLEHCHPHMLRHTFAMELYDDTKDLRLVAEALGHSSIETTTRYTRRRRSDQAQKISDAFERISRARERPHGEHRLARLSGKLRTVSDRRDLKQEGHDSDRHLEGRRVAGTVLEVQPSAELAPLGQDQSQDAAQEKSYTGRRDPGRPLHHTRD